VTKPRQLSVQLRAFVVEQLEALAGSVLAEWQPPRVLAGHAVGPDVRADLAFTLAHLADGGTTDIAGTSIHDAIAATLRPIDGAATHTFFSYRVAETLARYGPFATNALVADWSPTERANVAEACDSTSWLPLLDEGLLPANYAAVLTRCEVARAALGLDIDDAVLADLTARAADLLARNPRGYLDDEVSGGGRYDMYTLDLALFCEPFADRLPAWPACARAACHLVEHTIARDGTPIAWGRSTGLLGLCHTIEMAALACRDSRDLVAQPARWLRFALLAAEHLAPWFRDGLTTAHQHRSPYGYRGPARRLQLTLDTLGKLAWAANVLAGAPADLVPSTTAEALDPIDAWVPFEDDRPLGVWAHRSGHLSFVVPVVGTAWSDYLPAPHQPGLFDVPVDRPLAVATPMIVVDERTYAACGVPVLAEHQPGSLALRYESFPAMGSLDALKPSASFAGAAERHLVVERRTLMVDEHVHFERAPDVVALQICETVDHPLVVTVETDHPHRLSTVDTDGVKEWRSFWGELPRVHQIDLEPATDIELTWSVTPALRVGTDGHHHWYHRSLYDPMVPWVADRPVHRPQFEGRHAADHLRQLDVYHLHWPEWVFDQDVEGARRFVERLHEHGVALVWTQHNLLPHRPGEFEELYRVVAAGADGIIHHSRWGEERVRAARPYRDDALHRVIPHGHWGAMTSERTPARRAEAEASLGLSPCGLRIGIVGAPRPGKETVSFMHAFAHTDRTDAQLVVLSLADDEATVDDPRITALRYEEVDRSVWDLRLAAIDVLAFPFAPDAQMLTTGVIGDAVGAGLPGLITGWGFLTEVMGDAGIPMGDRPDAWTAAIDALDADSIASAAAAAVELQPLYDWLAIATETRTFLEDVAARVVSRA
jgi:hypothetical protein